MIISASRRTDLPAFYPEETIHKILQLTGGEQKTLFPQNITDAVVFWTKNAEPIIPHLRKLDNANIPYYFHYTINNYPTQIEPGLKQTPYERISTFINLSNTIGKERVIWRFDPFLTCSNPPITVNDTLNQIKIIGDSLYKYTNKLVFSFLDPYPKLPYSIHPPNKHEEQIIIHTLKEYNKKWNLILATCAEPINDPDIHHNKCIDPILLKSLGVDIQDFTTKDSSQRGMCGCYPSKDIGTYHTCKHFCKYCYANPHKHNT